MNRRVYLDETIWLALACEGELREAVRSRIRVLIQDGWVVVTSAFAISLLTGLHDEPGKFLDYLALIRRMCAEIVPLHPEDFEQSSRAILSLRLNLVEAVNLTIARRSRCDGMSSFSRELLRHAPGRAILPTGED